MKIQLNRKLWTLLLGILLASCQQTYWEDDLTPANLDAVGKVFMEILERSPEAYQVWCSTPNVRNISPNDVALLYGGDYGLHYALPLVSGNTITGFVIFPIEGDQNDSKSWFLKKPVIKEGQEIEGDAACVGIMRTKGFAKWQKQNLKVSQALQDAYNSSLEILSKSICLTRSSFKGMYYCVYEMEFENYVNEYGEVVVVGMQTRELKRLCEQIVAYLQTGAEVHDVSSNMLQFICTEDEFDFILQVLQEYLYGQHVFFYVLFADGIDNYDRPYDGQWSQRNSGGGISGGGSGGGGSSSGNTSSATAVLLRNVENMLDYLHLDEEFEEALYDFFELHVKKYPLFKRFVPLLYDVNLNIEVNPDKVSPKAGLEYDKQDNAIYLLSIEQLEGSGLIEELIHFVQFNSFKGEYYPLKNIEFEAKACYDLFLFPNGNHGNLMLALGLGLDYEKFEDFMTDYRENNYKMNDELWKVYHDLGEQWDDPRYHNVNGYVESEYNRNFPPRVFEKVFN